MFSFEELLAESLSCIIESSDSKKALINTLKAADDRIRAPKPSQSALLGQEDYGDWVRELQDFDRSKKFKVINGNPAYTPDNSAKLNSYPDNELYKIVEYVTELIQSDKIALKYRPYLIQQIAKGNIRLHTLRDDAVRFIKVLSQFAKLSKRAEWTAAGYSKNIYEYGDIGKLEDIIQDLRGKIGYAEADKKTNNSIVIHKAAFEENNRNQIQVANLLGMEAPPLATTIREYWLRRVLTMEGCIIYGKKTRWCTSASKGEDDEEIDMDVVRHTSDEYLPSGLFQIERQVTVVDESGNKTVKEPRHPILQFTPGGEGFDEMKNAKDNEARPKRGGTLRTFLIECYKKMSSKEFRQYMRPEVEYQSRPGFSYKINDKETYENLLDNLKGLLGIK